MAGEGCLFLDQAPNSLFYLMGAISYLFHFLVVKE